MARASSLSRRSNTFVARLHWGEAFVTLSFYMRQRLSMRGCVCRSVGNAFLWRFTWRKNWPTWPCFPIEHLTQSTLPVASFHEGSQSRGQRKSSCLNDRQRRLGRDIRDVRVSDVQHYYEKVKKWRKNDNMWQFIFQILKIVTFVNGFDYWKTSVCGKKNFFCFCIHVCKLRLAGIRIFLRNRLESDVPFNFGVCHWID